MLIVISGFRGADHRIFFTGAGSIETIFSSTALDWLGYEAAINRHIRFMFARLFLLFSDSLSNLVAT